MVRWHWHKTTGLTIDAGANNSSTVTITGTMAALNAALDGLEYTPDSDFHGNGTPNIDALTVTVNDLGNVGSGGALSDTATVNISINSVVGYR